MSDSDQRIEELRGYWNESGQPPAPSLDPQTILDCNMEDTAWLYNCMNEETEWLSYNGDTADVVQ